MFFCIEEYMDVFIWELPDEYFLVITVPIVHKGIRSSSSYKDSEFYKCDQWKGVECLFRNEIFSE